MRSERSEWVRFGTVLFLLAIAAAGCAKSEDPPKNGQSHWLEECRSDAECGELSCVCGLCTERCTSDSACGDEIEAQCVDPEQLAFASCGSNASQGICVPVCDSDSDCSALSEELTCSEALCRPKVAMAMDSGMMDSSMTAPDSSMMEPDSSMTIEDSGSTKDAMAMDSGMLDSSMMAPDSGMTMEDAGSIPDGTFASDATFDPDASVGVLPVLVCADSELDRSQAPTVEVIGVRGPNDPSWVLAGNGLVYRADPDQDDVLMYGASSSEPEAFPVPQTRLTHLVTDGDAIYYGAAPSGSVRVGRIDMDDSSHVYLALEEQSNMLTLVMVPGGLLFMAHDAGSDTTASLYRIGREPGPSELLAVQQGQVISLTVLGSSAYYIVFGDEPGDGRQLYRVSAEASSVPEALGEPTLGLGDLVTDGLSLFATIGEDFDSLGNPIDGQGVVRVSTVDGSLEMLHEVDSMEGGLIVSGTDLYFAGRRGDERGVFRARTAGAPELVAAIDARVFGLTAGEGYLYVALFCEDSEHVLRFPKI